METSTIPSHLIGTLSSKELAFYTTLQGMANTQNMSKPDLINKLIADKGYSKASLYRWIAKFEELGILTINEQTIIGLA